MTADDLRDKEDETMSSSTPRETPDQRAAQPPEQPLRAGAALELQQEEQPRPYQVQTFKATLFTVAGYATLTIYALSQQTRLDFLRQNLLWLILAAVLVLAVAVAIDLVRWSKSATAKARAGLSILITPLLLGVLVILFFLPPPWQIFVLRVGFILAACLLPGTMYYLFIATKKYSLVNEFLANLGRLGLPTSSAFMSPAYRQACDPNDPTYQQRVLTYLEKFQAVYGTLPTEYVEQVLAGTPRTGRRGERSGTQLPALTEVFGIHTALPVILATALAALGWLVTLPPWEGSFIQQAEQRQVQEPPAQSAEGAPQTATEQPAVQEGVPGKEPADWADRWLKALDPIRTPVRFAFLGAYFFCLQMLFRRYVRRDLRASAYVSVSLRITLAVIGTWVWIEGVKLMPERGGINAAVQNEYSMLVAGFVIGVFPRVVWQFIQSISKRVFGLVVPSFQTQLPLSDLEGLTVWHEARLEEEDIENVPNMASADLVDLMLNTRIPPDRIVDWVDQGILYTHLGSDEQTQTKRRAILRSHGIYTASALIETYKNTSRFNDTAEFEKILNDSPRSPVRSILAALDTNPNLKLIQTWRAPAVD
jgi:hypothetical protein